MAGEIRNPVLTEEEAKLVGASERVLSSGTCLAIFKDFTKSLRTGGYGKGEGEGQGQGERGTGEGRGPRALTLRCSQTSHAGASQHPTSES